MRNSAVRMLEEAARHHANCIALEDGDVLLTYAQYLERSQRIGTGLIRSDLHRDPVVIMLPKSADALCAFMGAMFAGCPYVPMNMGTPVSRSEKMFENLKPSAIVCYRAQADEMTQAFPNIRVLSLEDLLECEADLDALERSLSNVTDTDPIYIMYTSGSTGMPKGVTIPHIGVIDYAHWVVERFGFDENTVMANQSAFYFDNSIFDIYGSMLCGCRLVIVPESMYMFPSKLPQYLRDHDITSIFWVPSIMINVANSGALEGVDLPKLKNIAFCGEVMPNPQLNIWRRALPGRNYANLYGPTEISDVCCYYVVDREFADSDPLPIGIACENMRIHILTEDNREAEVNEQGELCVVGSGLALGYWNAPEITAKVFVNNPLQPNVPQRMYRTGDLAYRNEEGLIMFQGRKDNQIKLRGNRIELGEIESAAMCVPGVENVCAVLDQENQQIVLFLETKCSFLLRRFNLELKKYVPNYMLPGKLVCMERLPHTPNDKIDRVALKNSLKESI